jgi:hypothetical protein
MHQSVELVVQAGRIATAAMLHEHNNQMQLTDIQLTHMFVDCFLLYYLHLLIVQIHNIC